MRRRHFMKALGAGAAALALGRRMGFGADRSPAKPNILFIFADDQTYESIRALGYDEVETPNLDRLVRGGVTFTHAYNQGAWHGPPHVQFRSPMPIVRGERKSCYDAVYGGYMAVQRMVARGNYKLLLYPQIRKVLLFDLKDDPDEMKDLAGDPAHRSTVKMLFAKLLALQKQTGDSLDLKSAYLNL